MERRNFYKRLIAGLTLGIAAPSIALKANGDKFSTTELSSNPMQGATVVTSENILEVLNEAKQKQRDQWNIQWLKEKAEVFNKDSYVAGTIWKTSADMEYQSSLCRYYPSTDQVGQCVSEYYRNETDLIVDLVLKHFDSKILIDPWSLAENPQFIDIIKSEEYNDLFLDYNMIDNAPGWHSEIREEFQQLFGYHPSGKDFIHERVLQHLFIIREAVLRYNSTFLKYRLQIGKI